MTAPRRPRRLRTVLLLLAGFAGLSLLLTWLLPRQAMPVPPAVVQVRSGQPDGGAPETMPIEDVARWTEAAREPGTLLRFPMHGGAPAGGDPSWLPEAYKTIETLGSLTEEETGYFIRICMSSMRMVCPEMEELLQRRASMAASDFALAHVRLTHNINVRMCAADALAKGRYILVRGGDEYPGVPLLPGTERIMYGADPKRMLVILMSFQEYPELAATHEQRQLLLDRQSIERMLAFNQRPEAERRRIMAALHDETTDRALWRQLSAEVPPGCTWDRGSAMLVLMR